MSHYFTDTQYDLTSVTVQGEAGGDGAPGPKGEKGKDAYAQQVTPWFLYHMVAHFTMLTNGVYQAFRFVECIWLHRKSRQIRLFFGKDLFYFIFAQHVLSYHLV